MPLRIYLIHTGYKLYLLSYLYFIFTLSLHNLYLLLLVRSHLLLQPVLIPTRPFSSASTTCTYSYSSVLICFYFNFHVNRNNTFFSIFLLVLILSFTSLFIIYSNSLYYPSSGPFLPNDFTSLISLEQTHIRTRTLEQYFSVGDHCMYEAVRSLDYLQTALGSPPPHSPPLSQQISVCIDQLSEVRT